VGHTNHSITSHGTLNALTDLSAHVINVQREKGGGQRAPLFDTIRGIKGLQGFFSNKGGV